MACPGKLVRETLNPGLELLAPNADTWCHQEFNPRQNGAKHINRKQCLDGAARPGEWGRTKAGTGVHRTALCVIQFFRTGNKGETIQFYILTASRILDSQLSQETSI